MNWRLNFIFLDRLGARTASSREGGAGPTAPAGGRQGLPAPGRTQSRAGSRPSSSPRLPIHHAPSAYALGSLPSPGGRPSPRGRLPNNEEKVPPKLALPPGTDHPAGAHGAQAGREERSPPDFLPPPPPRRSRQEKFSRQGQACPRRPENARVPRLRGRACSAARGERAEGGTGPAGAAPYNLAPGHPGPPPQRRPRLPSGAPFPPRLPRGTPAGVRPGHRGAASQDFAPGCVPDPRPLPDPAAPTFLPPSRARAARGGRRGRAAPGGGERSEEEREHRPRRGARPSCSR